VRTAAASARQPEAVIILSAIALLAAVIVAGGSPKLIGPLVIVTVFIAALHRSLFKWHSLVAMILAIVLFVPIGRYHLPGSLPFNLELYRVAVMLVVVIWLTSLLIDPKVRIRRTPFDTTILLILATILASELSNPGRVQTYGSYVMKTLTFFFSFVLVYYITATTLRSRRSVLVILKLLAAGGAIIGVLGIVELRTGTNFFDRLHPVIPILIFDPSGYDNIVRGGNLRIFGPAQHPIALGAALAMIVPISVYLARVSGRRWIWATLATILGALATGSRTAITMMLAMLILYLIKHRRETVKILPLLAPAIVVVHIFLPGAIGGFKEAFFPKGGIIAEQSQLGENENAQLAGGRIRQIKPMVGEASRHPLFGEGMGTRITGFFSKDRNAPILDDQWLNNLLDVGYIGFGLWIWLFVRAIRKLLRRGKELPEDDDDRWLYDGLAASILGFAVGMLTFDAFGFTQVFFIFWILLGVSAALLAVPVEELVRERPGPRPVRAVAVEPVPATH
jgi:polysaccharide biosynthesis protein PslJ